MNVRRISGLIFGGGMLLSTLWMANANERAHAGAGKQNGKLETFYYGEELCSKCHNMTPDQVKKEVPAEKSLLYRGIEMEVWFTKDKHKNATTVLAGERGKLMAKNLKYDVTKSAQCLSCHGVYVTDEKLVDEESFKPDQRVKSGVTCVACHGAYSDWVNEHSKPAKSRWKQFDREEKEAKFGLKDLWDPAKRAALCSSCHVGEAAAGKIVTHEMYAAGHPPLPGIEI